MKLFQCFELFHCPGAQAVNEDRDAILYSNQSFLCVCAEAIFSRFPDREHSPRRSPEIKNGLNSPKHGELKICSSEPRERLRDEMCEKFSAHSLHFCGALKLDN